VKLTLPTCAEVLCVRGAVLRRLHTSRGQFCFMPGLLAFGTNSVTGGTDVRAMGRLQKFPALLFSGDLGSNSGRRYGKPATDAFRHCLFTLEPRVYLVWDSWWMK
jgi:hypothetical protein